MALTKSSLRHRILAFVGTLILLFLVGSILSLYRVSEVNRGLDMINRVWVPLGRMFAQMQSDAEVFSRELDRRLGSSHWNDPRWKARPHPQWIEDILDSETQKVESLIRQDLPWANPETKEHWIGWVTELSNRFNLLRSTAGKLYQHLEQRDFENASRLYPIWTSNLEEWKRQLQWGAAEYDRTLHRTFASAEDRVSELQMGLRAILLLVISLSLLVLWFGERALRPLAELTQLAQQITKRGLRKEDKSQLPEIPLSRNDEVTQLSREFHRMATTLLERELIVDEQNGRLQEQNRLLREMGELKENILNSIDSVIVVTDLKGNITQYNPVALEWLGNDETLLKGTNLLEHPKIQSLDLRSRLLSGLSQGPIAIHPTTIEDRIFGGQILALKHENGWVYGWILLLDDLSDELRLQDRLRHAENLAAVGRMSAQVAHEVRNPLHSIGLEAEMAADMAGKFNHLPLKNALQSILVSVDRLEKITQNYLKLSRLSMGEKTRVDLSEILESVLATYASVCERQKVAVNWERNTEIPLLVWGDGDLLEQALGNLMNNSLQALTDSAAPKISFYLSALESGRAVLRIQDNGPGVAKDVRKKLFDPFVTTRAQGTGLGLTFVKRVIEEHGGEVEYLDRSEGACFEMRLPMVGIEQRIPPRLPSLEVSTHV
ncbi:HAMP domain-containing protein [bacterium]|jgi:signal transduction histidine kinase|nr:HAMP domain-containing protein [bacterium]